MDHRSSSGWWWWLRKQEEQEKETPPLPLPPSPPHTLTSQSPPQNVVEDVGKPKLERPRDLKRAYDKRWRIFEVDRWKFATKPVVEEEVPQKPEVGPVLVPAPPNNADLPEPHSPKDAPSGPHRSGRRRTEAVPPLQQ
ncbi:hypothetical protein PAXRUDRAFT_645305 [Paxillus rubicundulus Ve08.2h10]|uniref:Uncharacterized protein n=1 Tax=Paxillus rubicundulus Ve08.2h10 TaxID=930991 RepID=A0A0D0E6M5_9AGAM|nr:hypothetical protein PAXRUDRAFT_645305 [Paxillus rubicundulus Ve08.2h10]